MNRASSRNCDTRLRAAEAAASLNLLYCARSCTQGRTAVSSWGLPLLLDYRSQLAEERHEAA